MTIEGGVPSIQEIEVASRLDYDLMVAPYTEGKCLQTLLGFDKAFMTSTKELCYLYFILLCRDLIWHKTMHSVCATTTSSNDAADVHSDKVVGQDRVDAKTKKARMDQNSMPVFGTPQGQNLSSSNSSHWSMSNTGSRSSSNSSSGSSSNSSSSSSSSNNVSSSVRVSVDGGEGMISNMMLIGGVMNGVKSRVDQAVDNNLLRHKSGVGSTSLNTRATSERYIQAINNESEKRQLVECVVNGGTCEACILLY